ncbi:MAG: serine hydrolase [Pseudonocardia sp.]
MTRFGFPAVVAAVRHLAVVLPTGALLTGALLTGGGSAGAAPPPPTPPPGAGATASPNTGASPASGPASPGATATPGTIAPPTPAGACVPRTSPPPPVDTSEVPRPGQRTPGPLPVPARPVGGPLLGGCTDVLPPGAPTPPSVTAASWVLADLDTGAVLAARDPHGRHRPASTLKVLTALVALRRLALDTVVEGTQQDADMHGSRVGIGPGGRYTVRQLLTGLIMNSGNDAANALSRQLGGVPATLAAMSATAGELGALDTRPATPSGLDGPGMSTSAYDLALIYRVAMREPAFAEINRTRLFAWPGFGSNPGFDVSTDNRLLASYPGAIGGKTGFTDDARHTLIAAAERGGRRLAVVLLRGEQRPIPIYQQAARLLDYGFALRPGTEPVGMLVDSRPADPSTAVPTAVRGSSSATAPTEDPNRAAGLVTIGGGALLGMLLSVLIARRRPSGEHTGAASLVADPGETGRPDPGPTMRPGTSEVDGPALTDRPPTEPAPALPDGPPTEPAPTLPDGPPTEPATAGPALPDGPPTEPIDPAPQPGAVAVGDRPTERITDLPIRPDADHPTERIQFGPGPPYP